MTERIALVAASALCVIPTAYAAQRVVEVWAGTELDPALVPPSPQVALFWRMAVAAILAVGTLGPFWKLAERSPQVSVRVAEGMLLVSFLVVVVAAGFAP